MCILGNKSTRNKKNKVFHNQHSLLFDVSFWVSFVYLYKEVSIYGFCLSFKKWKVGRRKEGDAELMHVRCRHDS